MLCKPMRLNHFLIVQCPLFIENKGVRVLVVVGLFVVVVFWGGVFLNRVPVLQVVVFSGSPYHYGDIFLCVVS